jgi:phosphatidylglycerophosphatase A
LIKLIETDETVRKVVLGTPAGFLAFGFGAGLARYAPGTMGTIVAIPFAIALKSLPPHYFWISIMLAFLLGIYLCEVTSKRLRQHDPGGIVWDEMVGYWLTISLLPVNGLWWLAAFVLFRFFDIVKPWPIRRVEKGLGGGLGIMVDDIIAALYAMIVLTVMQHLAGKL